jgi:hypothetical protein
LNSDSRDMCFSSSVSESREADPIPAPARIASDDEVFGRGVSAIKRMSVGASQVTWTLGVASGARPVAADIPISGCFADATAPHILCYVEFS